MESNGKDLVILMDELESGKQPTPERTDVDKSLEERQEADFLTMHLPSAPLPSADLPTVRVPAVEIAEEDLLTVHLPAADLAEANLSTVKMDAIERSEEQSSAEKAPAVQPSEIKKTKPSAVSPTPIKKPMPMSRKILALAASVVVIALLAGTFQVFMRGRPAQAASSFSFSTASDYAQNSTATLSLQKAASLGVNFHLGLGDYSYIMPQTNATVDSWVNYAKPSLGNVPFVLLAGNHDHNAGRYVTDLPNKVGAVGSYGKEYYFDYPAGAPLARFVAISPTQTSGDLFGWTYAAGTSHYNFLVNAIDSARAAHIPWVIVAMHEPCLTAADTNCSGTPGLNLVNLLVSKKVDLVLQGHKHDVEVSKQLALNTTTCKSISLTTYNSACVVNGASSMKKGAGTVFATYSTAGFGSLSPITAPAVTKGYFRSWMTSSTWGIAKISITATSLSDQFVSVKGTYTDSFSIA